MSLFEEPIILDSSIMGQLSQVGFMEVLAPDMEFSRRRRGRRKKR